MLAEDHFLIISLAHTFAAFQRWQHPLKARVPAGAPQWHFATDAFEAAGIPWETSSCNWRLCPVPKERQSPNLMHEQ